MVWPLSNRPAPLAVALALTIAFPSAAEATTIVGQWNMDNTFGTTMEDSSGNGNDGTTYNIVTSGGGYIFDGGTSKVIVPDSPTLNPGTSDFSFSVQLQTDTIPPRGRDYDILRKGISTTRGGEYKLELINVNGSAKALCVVKDSAGHSKSIRGGGPLNLADNVLRTITCKKTATSLSVQVTSRPLNSKSANLGSISNNQPLTIGVKLPNSPENDLGAGDWYNGLMRSVTISVEP
jgi:hypothetical protein